MYERFTDGVRKAVQLANEEAMRAGFEFIATEHLLVGLLRVGADGTAKVLEDLGVQPHGVRREINAIIEPRPMPTAGKLGSTPGLKRVLEIAIQEARGLKHEAVGTEHLLLALLAEKDCVAARVLVNLGVNLAVAREVVLLGLGGGADQPVVSEAAPPAQLLGRVARAVECLEEASTILRELKEEAVAAGDFQRAAVLRDELERFRKSIEFLLRKRADPG